jgi:hypothetical protein
MKNIKLIYLFALVIFIFTGCMKQEVVIKSQPKVIEQPKPIVVEELEPQEIPQPQDDNSNIAIVFSSKIIGKYAINATNAVMNYLIYKNNSFNLKAYDIPTENIQDIQGAFDKINSENITKVIALFTKNGALNLANIQGNQFCDIYLPLVKKDDVAMENGNITYGSIDYGKQLDKLLSFANPKTIEFFDNSTIGSKLSQALKTKNINLFYSKEISNNTKGYFNYFKGRVKKLNNASLIVNMAVVKTSIILSQINANEIKLSNILSTQLNYTPFLFSLTQVEDRQNMIIASSIGKTDDKLQESNLILDNDIRYNWVNYSTIIGAQYLINKDISEFEGVSIKDNQIDFTVELFHAFDYAFEKLQI